MSYETIYDEVSPNGNVTAFVGQDECVAYFYIQSLSNDMLPLRSCWIRNLAPAPETVDLDRVRDGLPAMLSRSYTRSPEPSEPLQEENLSIVWFEEGDAAALLDDNEVIAIIPPWSGKDGFNGYSLECGVPGPICWPLLPDSALYDRIERALKFWQSWQNGETPWDMLRHRSLSILESFASPHTHYFAIDGGQWPPKGLVRVTKDENIILSTIGVSLRPQPTVELYVEDPARLRRIELAIGISSKCSESVIMEIARFLSALCNLPWASFSWLGNGHTLPCDVFVHEGMEAIMLTNHPPDIAFPDLGLFMGDPINLLWAIPISGAERELAREMGSCELMERLEEAGVTWCYQQRGCILTHKS